MRVSKYTDEMLIAVINTSVSAREVLGKLGLGRECGHKDLRRKIRELGVGKLQGRSWSKGKIFFRKSNEELFRKNSRTSTHNIRIALLKRGIKKHQCEMCGNTTWLGRPIPLEVHHANGDNTDHRLENLLLHCPNCHCFTPTYKSRNKKCSVVNDSAMV